MLKLEKSSNSDSITIRIREKEHFFNSLFLKALAIALLFHFSALILFQVTPFSLTSTFVFPPVQVQSHLEKKGISTLVVDPVVEEKVPPPPFSIIPPLYSMTLPIESSLAPSLTFDPHALSSIGARSWPTPASWSAWEEPLKSEIALEEPYIQLTIS